MNFCKYMGIIKWETVNQKLVKFKIAKFDYCKTITKNTVFCNIYRKIRCFSNLYRNLTATRGHSYSLSAVGFIVGMMKESFPESTISGLMYLYHTKVLECFPDGFFLFLGYLWLGSAAGFGEVVVLAYIQAALALDLGDRKAGHF